MFHVSRRHRLERQARKVPVIRVAALDAYGNIWTKEDLEMAAERAAEYFSREEYYDSDEYFVRHFMRMCDSTDPRMTGK